MKLGLYGQKKFSGYIKRKMKNSLRRFSYGTWEECMDNKRLGRLTHNPIISLGRRFIFKFNSMIFLKQYFSKPQLGSWYEN